MRPLSPSPAGYIGDKSTSSSSANVQLDPAAEQVMLIASTDTYVKFGGSSVTVASGAGILIKANAYIVLTYAPQGGSTYLAYVSASSGTMNVTCGYGD